MTQRGADLALERALDAHTGEPVFELVPVAPGAAARPRVVGPGRKEREYLARAAELERELARRARELELAALCERGTRRAADRLERRLAEREAETARLDAEQKRLLVALGALQRENELLRERLALTEGPRAAARLPAPVERPTSPARGGGFRRPGGR
ncbi:MAG: hypothetical protein IPJ77_16145 [Planctomycetes bacterium]|nr:hypothetical protein [Planctomycetota bacterium]